VKSLPSKRRILEKRGEKEKKKKEKKQGLKSERGKTSFENLRDSKREKKKREDGIYKLLGEILSKESKKGDHIFL
jgi:hypothetical protein